MDSLLDNDLEQSRIWLSDLDGITWLWIGHGLQISDSELLKTRLLTTRHVSGGKCYPAFCHEHGTAESTNKVTRPSGWKTVYESFLDDGYGITARIWRIR